MSKPHARGGRATPKSRDPRATAPPSPAAVASASSEVLRRMFGEPADLRAASPLEVELRASFAWAYLHRDMELFRAMMDALQVTLRQGSVESRDYLRMLSTVAERPVAARFAEMLRHASITALPPAWINQAGRAVVEQALIYEQEPGDRYTLDLVCRYPNAATTFALLIVFDTSLAHSARFIDFIPEFDPANDDAPEGAVRRDLALDEARAYITRGLNAADLFLGPDPDQLFASRRALLEHYLHKLPEGFLLPERVARTEASVAPLVEEFLASPAAGPAIEQLGRDAARAAASKWLMRSGNLLDDEWRLTAAALSVLIGTVIDEFTSESEALGQLHAVLEPLVRYAHERKGWGDRYLEPALQLLHSWTIDQPAAG